jgi:hypothetical protein
MRVDALGNFFGDAAASRLAQVVDHLADRRRCGIDPVDMSEQFSRGVMIDIHHELIFEIVEPGTRDVRTFDHEDGIEMVAYQRGHANRIGARQLLIRVRRRVAHDDFDFFVQGPEQPEET